MKRLHVAGPVAAAFVVAIAMLAGLGVGIRAGAQLGADTYTFPLTGAELSVQEPWALDAGATVETADANVVKLDGEDDNVLLGFFPANTPVEEADAAMVGPYQERFDDVQVIESGETAAYAYALSVATIDGAEYGVFSLYSPQRPSGFAEAAIYIGPLSGFGQGLDEAKQDIAIDGVPIFGGVEGEGLQNALAAQSGAATPVAVVMAPPLPSPGPATPSASPAATPAD